MDARHPLAQSLDALCEKLSVHAILQETGGEMAVPVALLRHARLLDDTGKAAPRRTARNLMQIAGANLSVARLFEGHVNALRLIEAHGDEAQLSGVRELVREGAFLGVWGADGDRPVRATEITGPLDGGKKYASGLGTVTHALISVDVASQMQLCLIEVQDRARQDGAAWSMSGMVATRSGHFDVTGIDGAAAMWIGPPTST